MEKRPMTLLKIARRKEIYEEKREPLAIGMKMIWSHSECVSSPVMPAISSS